MRHILPSLVAPLMLCSGAFAQPAEYGESKTPPVGPPWVRDFATAQQMAADQGKPIFVYSTKTYCPHCVVMEKNLLVNPDLASSYDDVIWMYVYQDFSHDEADRKNERVAIRFGITSWPQHFLVDPYTMNVIGDTGRELNTFRTGVASAEPKVTQQAELTTQKLIEIDTIAASLEGDDVKIDRAAEYLKHPDVVVRYRAVQRVAKDDPARVVAAAAEILDTPHDQLRFLVCGLLAEHGDGSVREKLESLLTTPDGSKNPNVLRINAVKALARCGDARSIDVIAPFATSGEGRNSLTKASIDAIVSIAEHHADAVEHAKDTLVRAFPTVPADVPETELRFYRSVAVNAHAALQKLTGEAHEFPTEYDNAAREILIKAWSE
ncbi:MAG: thioredoxin family protein [Phycisphaeraceae bacterium]|nr:thioredoxin family protein [Phycisphaerales bacterium]MCB9859834.1 thioredoxin family protein [Phycisphaeraceae bacterium]